MEEALELGISATAWLQETYPALKSFMLFITDFGRFEVYLLLLPLIYWCLEKERGARLSYLLVISTLINAIVKHWLRGPRPYWIQPELGLAEAVSYGAPSGHTQTAVVVALVLAAWANRGWARILAVVYIFLMGLSRIYLGVHFVHDVLAGLLIGCGILGSYVVWREFIRWPYFRLLFGQRLLIATAVPVAIGLLYGFGLWIAGPAQTNLTFDAVIGSAENESFEAVVEMIGAMLGMGIGFLFERTYNCFKVKHYLPQLVLRYFIGMAGAIAIWLGLRVVFAAITPDGMFWLALVLRFIRYTLLTFWIAHYAPKLFVQLGFAESGDEPEIMFSVESAVVRASQD